VRTLPSLVRMCCTMRSMATEFSPCAHGMMTSAYFLLGLTNVSNIGFTNVYEVESHIQTHVHEKLVNHPSKCSTNSCIIGASQTGVGVHCRANCQKCISYHAPCTG
jgi:hypothetical protein